MQSKLFLLTAAAIITVAALLTIPLTQDVDAQSKKKPVSKCNNVKIHANVTGVEENNTVVGVVTLGQNTASKMGTVEENETSITLPFNFKKIVCPEIGTPYTGFVNGTEFGGEIKSVKKPNRVNVDL